MRRALAAPDKQRSHGLMVRIREMLLRCSMRRIRMGGKSTPRPVPVSEREIGVYWYLFSNHRTHENSSRITWGYEAPFLVRHDRLPCSNNNNLKCFQVYRYFIKIRCRPLESHKNWSHLLDSGSFTGIGAVAGAASAQSPQCWSVSVTEQVPINTNFSPRCSQATLGAKFNKRCDRGEHTLNFEARPRSAGPGPESLAVLSSGGKQRSGELGLEGGLDFRSGFEPSGLDRPGPRAARQAAASTGTRTTRGWATETDIGLTQAV